MDRRGQKSLVTDLRRSGIRLYAGPWILFVGKNPLGHKGLIIALGRVAGPAVTRVRVRRVARTVFGQRTNPVLDANILLSARASVSAEPRRRLRAELLGLKARAIAALGRERLR